jgi:protein gp37
MGKETSIAWTDHTFNGWWGCTRVGPDCLNCYAEAFDKRVGGDHWGPGKPRRTFGQKHWDELLAWNREAEREGRRHLVFSFSMADVMDVEAPAGELERFLGYIDRTPWLIYQLLTKRPEEYARRLPGPFRHGNGWLGVTAGNQAMYDLRWPHMAALRAKPEWAGTPIFVSYEPAIGPLSMRGHEQKPDQLIFGGETGPHFRSMELGWAENAKAECEEFGITFFMKQVAARTTTMAAEFIPPHLQVRQFPIVGQ